MLILWLRYVHSNWRPISDLKWEILYRASISKNDSNISKNELSFYFLVEPHAQLVLNIATSVYFNQFHFAKHKRCCHIKEFFTTITKMFLTDRSLWNLHIISLNQYQSQYLVIYFFFCNVYFDNPTKKFDESIRKSGFVMLLLFDNFTVVSRFRVFLPTFHTFGLQILIS